jgi:hypothetical protein
MSLNGHYNGEVRGYLLALQTGQKPGSRPPIPEYWATPVETVERSYDRSGGNAEVVRSTVSTLSKQIPHLRELLETERPATPLARVDETFGMPELVKTKPNEALAAQASPVLDAIIAYIRYWATRSHPGYHEGAALWLLATIAARRIRLKWRGGVWPALYFMFVSRSGRVAKTEAPKLAKGILRECGLDYMLIPKRITPQRLVSRMAGRYLPRNYSTMTPIQKEKYRLQTAFSGQVGMVYDEMGDFLADISNARSSNAMFSELLRQFYDNDLTYDYETNSRDQEVIEMPGLSFVGTSTPDSLQSIPERGKFWTNGTAARIFFYAPPPDFIRTKNAPLEEAVVPSSLVKALTEWHERLGVPHCEIIDLQEQADLQAQADEAMGKKPEKRLSSDQQYQIERDPLPQHNVYWTDEIYQAHQAYYDELMHLSVAANLDSRFDANYTRLADMALMIAMLLASLENDNHMDMRHWARGQQIAEHGRQSLHCLLAQLDAGTPLHHPGYDQLDDAVIDVLSHKLPKGEKASARQIAQWGNTLLRKAGSPEVRKILDELVDSGDSNVVREGNGRSALYGLKETE